MCDRRLACAAEKAALGVKYCVTEAKGFSHMKEA